MLFTAAFEEVFKAEGLRVISTLPRTPRMNAICERVIGTLRRELLDWTLILGERHLVLILREYVVHYNRHRRPWRPTTGRAAPASRRAGRRRDRPGEGTRKIMMPYGRCWSSLQVTGHADFWHPTG